MNINNNWTGIGNIGQDLELRQTKSGTPVTSFSIACNNFRKDADGNSVKDADWVNVVAWGRLAEVCASNLSKGKRVAVQGRLIMRSYTDSKEITHRTAEIQANQVEFL
jgi:single-strand DNA-binding protein